MSRSGVIARLPEQMPQAGLAGQLVQLAAGSNPVKVGQTDLLGQAGSQNQCKSITMNSLQNKSRSASQTMLNLVNHDQNRPIASARTSLLCVCRGNNHEMNLRLHSFDDHSFDHSGLLEASKIKVNQACSRLIKVNQAILKHFFRHLNFELAAGMWLYFLR
jgi:hypothetical protein